MERKQWNGHIEESQCFQTLRYYAAFASFGIKFKKNYRKLKDFHD